MVLPESPRSLAGDGALIAWGAWVIANPGTAIITALTIVILLLRAMILFRQWRRGQ